jgi:hypothetical protein
VLFQRSWSLLSILHNEALFITSISLVGLGRLGQTPQLKTTIHDSGHRLSISSCHIIYIPHLSTIFAIYSYLLNNALGLISKFENMSVQFINNADIDGKTRKLIRSHVAKGRNVGKKLPSRRKQSELGVKSPAPFYSYHSKAAKDVILLERESHEAGQIERQLGYGLSVLSLPAKLNSALKGLLKGGKYMLNFALYILDISLC